MTSRLRTHRKTVVSTASGKLRTARAVPNGHGYEGQVVAGGRIIARTTDVIGVGWDVTKRDGSGVYAGWSIALDRAVKAAKML